MKTAVFHRHTSIQLPKVIGGEGCYLIDSQGNKYLDGSGGAAVSCLGHQHPEVIETIKRQAQEISYAHTSFFTNEPMEKLAEFLIKENPDFSHVYFVSGGSEAVETAIKLARQYVVEIGKSSKYKVIARRQSYHGNTLGALSAGGNLWRRKMFDALMTEGNHISPCYAYRDQKEHESEEAYGLRVARELEEKILDLGADHVLAFIAEPVVGATMGCVPAVKGYFNEIHRICKKYDVLLILDEVMCGMGRTGTLFAYEQEGITADLVTLAKGLGGGYQPIGAVMVSEKIYSAIESGTGFFQHGHTYMGHTLACAAALTVQEIIKRDHLLEKVIQNSEYFTSSLHHYLKENPFVGNIRGKGFFMGIELVENIQNKVPFPPERMIHQDIKKQALKEGLMCYPMGGTIDGNRGNHILLAPPFIASVSQLEEISEKLGRAIQKATGL